MLVTFSFYLFKINIISVNNNFKYFGWVHHAKVFNQTVYTECEKVIAINARITMLRNMGLRAERLKKKLFSLHGLEKVRFGS